MDDACRPLTFGSLFAGIGGIDRGFERAGMVGKWQVEIDPYARRVLAKHWPDVRRWDDIRTFPPEPIDDWRVDVIAGGFPCQDISYAGKGAGLHGERSGLFFELIRVVRVLGPRIIVLENVAALLTRGMDQVLGTLASIGFDAEWHCIPAASVGAPHLRDRVFVLALNTYSDNEHPVGASSQLEQKASASGISCRKGAKKDRGTEGAEYMVADSDNSNSERLGQYSREVLSDEESIRLIGCGQSVSDTASNLRRASGHEMREALNWYRSTSGRDQWAVEPDVGRVADGIPDRVHRLRGLGNAVVPQVAEFIGRQIVERIGGDNG